MKFKEEIRYDYPLNSDSLVFDVGGYEGTFAQGIFDRYGCNIFVFEPVQEFYEKIIERFKDNPKITVFNHGLFDETTKVNIGVDGDGSSIYLPGVKTEKIRLINISDFVKSNNISHVDLLKINIEGGEYTLLEYLTETGFIKIFDNIQIQFHKRLVHHAIVEDAKELRNDIIKRLRKTHKRQWNYPYVWESWTK